MNSGREIPYRCIQYGIGPLSTNVERLVDKTLGKMLPIALEEATAPSKKVEA